MSKGDASHCKLPSRRQDLILGSMLRLDHMVLPTWDVEKSIAFYRDVLGLKLVDAYDGDD